MFVSYFGTILRVNQKIIPIGFNSLTDLAQKKEGDLAFVSGWGRCDWSVRFFPFLVIFCS